MDKTRRDEQDAWEHAESVKRNIHRLSLSRRFYLGAAEIKLKRNRATIVAARLRNRQLRSALNDLREKERCALGVNDLARVQKRVAAVEKYHNHLLFMSKVQHKLLLERQTDAEMAKIDCDDVLDQNTPPLRKHRALASVLKNGRSELQRAHAKDLNYQEKLKPMLDNHTIFDAQVDTLARTVAKKHQEFDELIFMYHDACRTREAARGQLQQVLKGNFEIGVRYYNLFRQPAKSSNKRTIAEIEEAIANLTTQLRSKSMKELYMALIVEQRKHIYMQYFKHELQEMVDNLNHGSTSAKSENEHLKRILVHLEQKLVQILQGLQGWMEGMREEKAKEHYARVHRTSIMIKDNYEKRHGASHGDDNVSTASTHEQD